jgi:hypothetical protein
MTRAEYLLNMIHEGAGGKVAGAAAVGSGIYLAKKHLGKGGDSETGKEIKKGVGNVARRGAEKLMGGMNTPAAQSLRDTMAHLRNN